jgi:hypothetical protein
MHDKDKILLAYDVASIPEEAKAGVSTGEALKSIMEIYEQDGILFYDSSLGLAPVLIEKGDFAETKEFVDVKSKEGRKLLVQYLKEDE